MVPGISLRKYRVCSKWKYKTSLMYLSMIFQQHNQYYYFVYCLKLIGTTFQKKAMCVKQTTRKRKNFQNTWLIFCIEQRAQLLRCSSFCKEKGKKKSISFQSNSHREKSMLLLFIINTFDTETNVVISVKIDGSCKA